jgi:hypothetical protein
VAEKGRNAMSEHDNYEWPVKAYKSIKIQKNPHARIVRILSEYLVPESRFEAFDFIKSELNKTAFNEPGGRM